MEHDHHHEKNGESDSKAHHEVSSSEMNPSMKQGPQGSSGQHSGHGSSADQAAHIHAHEHELPAGGVEQTSAQAHTDHTGHEQIFRQRFWISLILSVPVLALNPSIQGWMHYAIPPFPASAWIAPIFATAVFIYGGLPFLGMAIPELKNRQPGMMTLISLAISVAFVYSLVSLFLPNSMDFFWELVTLIDIMLLGHWVEMRSVRQASRALMELAKLMPDTAERSLPGGGTEIVKIAQVAPGDVLLIRPGASIPADGIVEEGDSEVNEAMLTGESKPLRKETGARVIAGTINGDGSLHIRVIATGEQTALAGIMRLVQQAQQSKSNTQVLADQAAGWLFYVALGVAVITGVAWTIASGFNAEVVARVATVLVIACPHALGLAVPLVVAITTSLGAHNGILVRDRLALEKSRLVDVVLFDKTGTLTEGDFGVVAMQTIEGVETDEALALAAAVEGESEHTMARGLRKSASERKLNLPPVSAFEAIKGRGAHARYDGADVYVGGPRLLQMLDLKLPDVLVSFTTQAEQAGQSVVHLVRDRQVLAAFALADVIRPESRAAVTALLDMGVEVDMLTGDSTAVASAVAAALNIKTYFAEVLPEHKDLKVAELQKQGKRVAMVGDGVNDAPALTRADVGIAIGSGTDVAIESAGIILVKNNPQDVVKVITLSRASYRKMIQNLTWAAGYNIVALPLAAGVLAPWGILLSPAVGALLMSVSTVIVAINAQTLRREKLSLAG